MTPSSSVPMISSRPRSCREKSPSKAGRVGRALGTGFDRRRIIFHSCPPKKKDVYPVGRPSIVFVQVMRVDSPPIIVASRPAGRAGTLVVGSPPLSLPVNAVFSGRLNVESDHHAAFRYIHRTLEDVIEVGAGSIRQWKVAEQCYTARVKTRIRNNIQTFRVARSRAGRVSETGKLELVPGTGFAGGSLT